MKKKQTVGTVVVETKDGSLQAATRKTSISKTSISKTSIPDDSLDSSPDTGTITSADALATEVTQGQLVWYNERKWYGFVRIGQEKVFLHRSTLDQFGLVTCGPAIW